MVIHNHTISRQSEFAQMTHLNGNDGQPQLDSSYKHKPLDFCSIAFDRKYVKYETYI